ncbi:DedA family protein [Shewanella sp. SM20]|uniref:DedA family protein n=1 Tax=Shewanella sp. SM20 TaxID=2912792 RepID=UPI0021D8AA7B|nr:DedA family protein [Shewanella sp. SM20]MCU8093919.1 DedA family protein [Shewanella sp. SM20]
MEQLYELAQAMIHNDLAVLANPKIALMVSTLICGFLVLENGFIPTAFLPGDSLLFLTGVLIYQDILHIGIMPLLVLATFTGTAIGYLQGRFLGHTQIYQKLLSNIDIKHQEKATHLIDNYGVITLLLARYIPFVRTVYPYILGATGISSRRFLLINFISSMVWIFSVVGFGYLISHTQLATKYQTQFMSIIIYLPVALLTFGIIALVYKWLSKTKEV